MGVAVVVAAFGHSVLSAASPPWGWSEATGARVFRHESATVVVLHEAVRPVRLLESLRLAGVRRVDLVVASRGGASDAHAVLALKDRYRGATVVAPPMHRVPHARTVRAGSVVQVGAVSLEIVDDTPALVVAVISARSLSKAASQAHGDKNYGLAGALPAPARRSPYHPAHYGVTGASSR